ncbi:hypothetical protein ACFVAV_29865 [Nocardia sp. NPDC057663]|uniref:hypothetical protein n=1 Tax=Nocardia sp. NPDC057663 TaxID=3346201 RepID=UPI00366EC98B
MVVVAGGAAEVDAGVVVTGCVVAGGATVVVGGVSPHWPGPQLSVPQSGPGMQVWPGGNPHSLCPQLSVPQSGPGTQLYPGGGSCVGEWYHDDSGACVGEWYHDDSGADWPPGAAAPGAPPGFADGVTELVAGCVVVTEVWDTELDPG